MRLARMYPEALRTQKQHSRTLFQTVSPTTPSFYYYYIRSFAAYSTGAKPYQCGDCSLRTNSQSSIYRHYQRRHGRKATTADVLVATTTEAEEAFAEDSATTSSEEAEEVHVAPPAPSKAEQKKSRRHSPYASARQTRQSESKKKQSRHEEVSTEEENFGVMQPLDTNVASTSYTTDSSVPLASSSTGVEYHYYSAGVVPEPPSVPYPVAGWTYDPYVPLDGPEYPVFVVQEEDIPECLESPYTQQQPLYADVSVIDPTLLAPPYAYAPQRSVSPAESLLSASSIDPYDVYDYAGDDVYQPLVWSSDFTFSPEYDYDPAYDASLYPPYTFYRQ